MEAPPELKLGREEQVGLALLFSGLAAIVIGVLSLEIHGVVYGLIWVGAGLISLGLGTQVLFKAGLGASLIGAGTMCLLFSLILHINGV